MGKGIVDTAATEAAAILELNKSGPNGTYVYDNIELRKAYKKLARYATATLMLVMR